MQSEGNNKKNTDEQIYGVYRSGSCICILRNYIKR